MNVMNGHLQIFIIAFILLLVSISNEPDHHAIYVYIIRYVHYLVFLFSFLYLLFFQLGSELDRFYLCLMLLIVYSWNICDCCYLSYMELLFYNMDLESTKVNIQPMFNLLFDRYTSFVLSLAGYMYIITVSVILYFLEIHIFIKMLYYGLFLYFFFHAVIQAKMDPKCYSVQNKYLAYIHSIYEKIER